MNLILLDGATASGKSEALVRVREHHGQFVRVGTKFTTRKRRATDNDWEFTFVSQIPTREALTFSSVGNEYGIDLREIRACQREGLAYALTCGDMEAITHLRAMGWRTTLIYVYRPLDQLGLEAVDSARGGTSDTERDCRGAERLSIASDYGQKLKMINHVLLNVGTIAEFHRQVDAVLRIAIEN